MLIITLMKQKKQIIIFTDLDGSLLDNDTFEFDEIEDYFRELSIKPSPPITIIKSDFLIG